MTPNPTPLAIGPELTIAFAAEWRATLLEAVQGAAAAGATEMTLDLSPVTDFDSAGVQLLLATRRSLAESGTRLRIQSPSAAVRDGLTVFGLQDLLADGAPAEA